MNKIDLLQLLYQVNYADDWDSSLSRFGLDTSFTLLDWILVDMLKQSDSFDLSKSDAFQTLQI